MTELDVIHERDHTHDRPGENPECPRCNPQLVKLPRTLGPFEDPSWQDDASILAHATYFGVRHHVLIFRVSDDADGVQGLDAFDGDDSETARAQWEDVCALYETRWQTVDLREYGIAGDWVIVAHPYGD